MQELHKSIAKVKEKAALVKQALDIAGQTSDGEHWEASKISLTSAQGAHKELLDALKEHNDALLKKAPETPKPAGKTTKPTKHR